MSLDLLLTRKCVPNFRTTFCLASCILQFSRVLFDTEINLIKSIILLNIKVYKPSETHSKSPDAQSLHGLLPVNNQNEQSSIYSWRVLVFQLKDLRQLPLHMALYMVLILLYRRQYRFPFSVRNFLLGFKIAVLILSHRPTKGWDLQ